MRLSPSHRPRSTTCPDDLPAPDRVDEPHAVTVADIAVACAALDYGCATWSSHQVDVVVARDEEDHRTVAGRLVHKIHRDV
jgi:hypothetical protein